MLASVNSLQEALAVAAAKVDIIDLKEPRTGALGGLPAASVKDIVSALRGGCPVSATIGDLPMHPSTVVEAVRAMAETGVDYVKIGFFPQGDPLAVLAALRPIAVEHRLIAVLFAEALPKFAGIGQIKEAGFSGVMLDTMYKSGGSLTGLMGHSELSDFVVSAGRSGLICGLAGSLVLEDIPVLLPLRADYLGFRGALCESYDRVNRLSLTEVRRIRQAIG